MQNLANGGGGRGQFSESVESVCSPRVTVHAALCGGEGRGGRGHSEGANLDLLHPRSSARPVGSGGRLVPSGLRCRLLLWACRPFTPGCAAAPMVTADLAAVPVWGPNHHRKVTEEAVAGTVRVGCEEGHLLSALWGMDAPGVSCQARQDRGCSQGLLTLTLLPSVITPHPKATPAPLHPLFPLLGISHTERK